jgi:hypothetical protein
VLPAIEALHAAWSKWSAKPKYAPFKDAVDAATAKLEEYYTKTADSDAHILAMCKYVLFKPLSIISLTILQSCIPEKRWDILISIGVWNSELMFLVLSKQRFVRLLKGFNSRLTITIDSRTLQVIKLNNTFIICTCTTLKVEVSDRPSCPTQP